MHNLHKSGESHVKLAVPQLPADIRTGGENVPLEYPQLYQIRAGDWRISYAVENNRLAILVLEVLGPDGESSKDAGREKMTKKMKVKLLDWPEGSGNEQVPPEVLSKKLKIKWLDMADDVAEPAASTGPARPLIKLKGSGDAPRTSRITLLDAAASEGAVIDDEQPVTPSDAPGM